MNFDKFFNSKFYKVLEFVYRLIITNLIGLLAIILGFGIFSLMSSLVSMIIIVRSMNSNTEFPIVRVFVNSFKKNYKRVLPLSLFYYFLIVLSIFNIFYFYTAFNEFGVLFYEIAFNLSIAAFFIILATFINACYIYVYFPNLNNRKVIKYSFTLIRVTIMQMIAIIIFLVLTVIFIYTFYIFIIFIFISLGLFIINLLLRNTYSVLVVDNVKSLDAFMYR